jgi:hypothetical protein
VKPISRWQKKARHAVQRLLPFFTNPKKQRTFERLMRRREALETRDARVHDRTIRALMDKGFSPSEAERLATTLDHSTRHMHDVQLLGIPRRQPRVRVHKEMPPSKRKSFNWKFWK